MLQINKKKCWQCDKKIGIYAIKCRCDYLFCHLHKYPEEHDCRVDYKLIGVSENSRIVANKVDKI